MIHNSDQVRNKLIEIINQGLMLKAIALNVGIDVNDLSRFKGGMECLKQSDVEVLSEYLNAVVIPQWNMIVPKKQMSMRDRIMANINKSNQTETKPKRRRNAVSLDLLRELDS